MKKCTILLLVLLLFTACRHVGDAVEGFPFRHEADGGWGIVAPDGTILIPVGTFNRFDSAEMLDPASVRCLSNASSDSSGSTVCESLQGDATGHANRSQTFRSIPSAVVNGRFTLTDSTGYQQLFDVAHPDKPLLHRWFARVGYFFEEVTLAQEQPNGPLMLIDRDGRTVKLLHQLGTYELLYAHNFREGRALVATSQGKFGYINTRGDWAVQPLYDRAFDFADGVALVGQANGEGEMAYRCIDSHGNTVCAVMTSHCMLASTYYNGWLAYRSLGNGQCGYIDRTGLPQRSLPVEVTSVSPLYGDLAVAATAEGKGIIKSSGEWLIPPLHADLQWLCGERVAIRSRQGWRLHDLHGHPLSELTFDTIGHFYSSGRAVVRHQGRSACIPLSGDTTQLVWMHQIVEDPEANGTLPQIFCRLPEGGDSGVQNSNSRGSEQAKDDETLSAIQQNSQQDEGGATGSFDPQKRQQEVGQLQLHTSISRDEWKRIGQQSPFFEEARRVASGKLEEQDASNRQMILNYVEHLRTAYTTKDIDFLEQLYSEQALIIVGTVVRSGEMVRNYLSPAQVIYNVKSKNQYLSRLRQVFKSNRQISVQFRNFRILRHPTQPGIYGVSLRQGYRSDHYADDGYLFLLWDFRNEAMPQIHVRTWQPAPAVPDSLSTPVEPLGLGDFNLR